MTTQTLPLPTAPPADGAIRRRLSTRVSRGHVVMVVAGVAGAVLSFAALHQGTGGTQVVVAAHEIRAGEAVRPADFRPARLSASSGLVSALVGAGDVARLRGRIAGTTIAAGEPVLRRTLRPRAARGGLRAMSIPIDPSHAVGGRLAAGDRVDVLFAGERAVSVIVADAAVLAVDARGHGGIGESSSPFTVTIAVTARESQLVAAAVADGDISLAHTTGADSAKGLAPEPLDRVGDPEATGP